MPAQIGDGIDNSLRTPLTLELVRLMLDRTLELALLRARLRQQRQSCWNVLALQWFSDEPADAPQSAPAALDEILVDKLHAIVPNMEALGGGSLYRAVLSHVEKLLLTVVLKECRGNQVKSADILGINRNTLRKKMRELQITPWRRSL
jgi:DNA-binding protein Fis